MLNGVLVDQGGREGGHAKSISDQPAKMAIKDVLRDTSNGVDSPECPTRQRDEVWVMFFAIIIFALSVAGAILI